jgi:hypothetical protein
MLRRRLMRQRRQMYLLMALQKEVDQDLLQVRVDSQR